MVDERIMEDTKKNIISTCPRCGFDHFYATMWKDENELVMFECCCGCLYSWPRQQDEKGRIVGKGIIIGRFDKNKK